MAGELLEIDATSEDAANVALSLVDNVNFFLIEHDYPAPEKDMQYASSTDTEGELPVAKHYKNRQIMVKLHVLGANDAARDLRVGYVQQKVGKIDRECGTLKRTTAAGLVIVFDLVAAKVDVASDKRFTNGSRAVVTIVFEARPFGRGTAATTSTSSETTLPALVFTVPSIPGDVPALGKLVVNEIQAVDQWWLIWGMQSRYYSSAASAALFWQAEALTPRGTAAAAVGPTGASGAGSNTLLEGSLTPTYAAVLSTQATGGGAHMTHIGDFNVWARVQRPTTNTGAVSLQLEWAEGDFRRINRNTAVSYAADEREGVWTLANLGQVHLSKAAQGTQRWEGRVLAKSSVAGDDLYVDCLMLVPVSEGSGQASGLQQYESVTSFSARDEFDQTAGALTGKTLPVGGTWAGAGDADDFAVETTGKTAQRAVASDADVNTGRFGIAGTATFTNVLVQADVKTSSWDVNSADKLHLATLARYTDTSNWVVAELTGGGSAATTTSVQVRKRLAGTVSTIASEAMPLAAATYYTVRFVVVGGRWFLWAFPTGSSPGDPVLQGFDSDLASGTLSSGKAGIYDVLAIGGSTPTRNYDNFVVGVPVGDAAVFASQSLEVRHDRVIREDSTGVYWTAPSKYEGNYLLVPPAGREARTARFIIKASRNDAETMSDSGIDDISAALTYTPRYLVVPE